MTTLAIHQLDELTIFYDEANLWVHRSRAALVDLTLAQKATPLPFTPLITTPSTLASPSTPATARSASTPPSAADEPMSSPGRERSPASPTLSADTPADAGAGVDLASLYMPTYTPKPHGRDNLAVRVDILALRRRARQACVLRQQERMLQLFGDVVRGRIESCAMIERILKHAKRR